MRSDTVKKGIQQAPHRSLFNALGLTEEELDRPLIGVVSSYNEIVPGHMNLDKITEAVKLGVAMAGGTPIMVPDPPGGYSDVIAFLYAGLINEKTSYHHLITVNLLLSRILPDPDCCYNTKHIQNVHKNDRIILQ